MKRQVVTVIIVVLCSMRVHAFQPFEPFTFGVIADPHISDAEKDGPDASTKMYGQSAALLSATVEELNRLENLDFTVVLGDLTRDAEPYNISLFKKIMSALRSPYYVILGNHDVNENAVFQEYQPGQSRAYMIQNFQGHGFEGPDFHWSIDPLANVHLIGLDTTITGDWGGELNKQGLQFLRQDLEANRGKLTIVLLHHQLYSYLSPLDSSIPQRYKFTAYNSGQIRFLLQEFPQVVMTLSGHQHLSTRYILEENIAYFAIPSTAVWPMRYVVFSVSPEEISYRTYDVPGDGEIRLQAKRKIVAEQIESTASGKENLPGGLDEAVLFAKLLSSQTETGTIPLQSDWR